MQQTSVRNGVRQCHQWGAMGVPPPSAVWGAGSYISGNAVRSLWALKEKKSYFPLPGPSVLEHLCLCLGQFPLITPESDSHSRELCCPVVVIHQNLPCLLKCSQSHLGGAWPGASAGSGSCKRSHRAGHLSTSGHQPEILWRMEQKVSPVGKKAGSCILVPSHQSSPFLGKSQNEPVCAPPGCCGYHRSSPLGVCRIIMPSSV